MTKTFIGSLCDILQPKNLLGFFKMKERFIEVLIRLNKLVN